MYIGCAAADEIGLLVQAVALLAMERVCFVSELEVTPTRFRCACAKHAHDVMHEGDAWLQPVSVAVHHCNWLCHACQLSSQKIMASVTPYVQIHALDTRGQGLPVGGGQGRYLERAEERGEQLVVMWATGGVQQQRRCDRCVAVLGDRARPQRTVHTCQGYLLKYSSSNVG